MDKQGQELETLRQPFDAAVDGEKWTITVQQMPGRLTMISENHQRGPIVNGGKFSATNGERTINFVSYSANQAGVIEALTRAKDGTQ